MNTNELKEELERVGYKVPTTKEYFLGKGKVFLGKIKLPRSKKKRIRKKWLKRQMIGKAISFKMISNGFCDKSHWQDAQAYTMPFFDEAASISKSEWEKMYVGKFEPEFKE